MDTIEAIFNLLAAAGSVLLGVALVFSLFAAVVLLMLLKVGGRHDDDR